MNVVYLSCIRIKNKIKKRKMNKDIKNSFSYLDFKIQEIFSARLTSLKNKLLLLHSFVLGLQLSGNRSLKVCEPFYLNY